MFFFSHRPELMFSTLPDLNIPKWRKTRRPTGLSTKVKDSFIICFLFQKMKSWFWNRILSFECTAYCLPHVWVTFEYRRSWKNTMIYIITLRCYNRNLLCSKRQSKKTGLQIQMRSKFLLAVHSGFYLACKHTKLGCWPVWPVYIDGQTAMLGGVRF